MQWLTAILAFATTMLIFAVVVSTIVETIHRALGSRTIGLKHMLRHFYQQVLLQHLDHQNPEIDQEHFIEVMTVVRAPTVDSILANKNSKAENHEFRKLTRWSFKLLSFLPTVTFMERLGASTFSSVVNSKSNEDRRQLLLDIAQKYESYGHESTIYFDSKARLTSVIVAIFVAWIFYIHPYNLIQKYLKNPVISEKITLLAHDPMEKYEQLVLSTTELRSQQNNLAVNNIEYNAENLDRFVEKLHADLEAANTEFEKLSNTGAPIGWPVSNVGQVRWPANENNPLVKIPYPKSPIDAFWLLMGGLLIGLGSPFWAKTIRQITHASNVQKNIAGILQPYTPDQLKDITTIAPKQSTAITSIAFSTSATASEIASSKDNNQQTQ